MSIENSTNRKESLYSPINSDIGRKDSMYSSFQRRTGIYYKDSKEKREIGSLRNALPANLQITYAKSLDMFHQLQDYVSTLEKKVEGIVEKKENDFLCAYQASMKNIQKELLDMKSKSDVMNSKALAESRINDLSKALEWFEKESLKLADIVSKQKKENILLKESVESIKKEKEFFELQAKKSKKKTKICKSVISSAKLFCNDIINALTVPKETYQEKLSAIFDQHYSQRQSENTIPQTAQSSSELAKRRSSCSGTKAKYANLITSFSKSNLSEVQIQTLLKEFADSFATKNESLIKSLNDKLEQKQKEIAKCKRQLNEERNNKGEYEKLFVSCVKTIQEEGSSKDLSTASEKRKVLELLVSNDDFITTIYNLIFGHKGDFPSLFNKSTYGIMKPTPPPMTSSAARKTAFYRVRQGKLVVGNTNKSFV